MEGSDETGVMQRIQSSFGNCSSSSVPKQANNHLGQMGMSINGQMQNLSVDGNGSNKRPPPSGIPPSHPHSQFAIPKLGTNNFAMGGPTHARSLSQSSFFSFDHLPPLSPSTFRDSPQGQTDLPMEDRVSNSQGSANPTLFTAGTTTGHSNEGGLPPRRGHRRSSSDVPLGFMSQAHPLPPQSKDNKPAQLVLKKECDWGGGLSSNERKHDQGEVVEDLFSAYMNLDNIDGLNSSSLEDKDMDSRASGTRTNESSENEVESGSIHGGNSVSSIEKREKGKRSAPGDIAPAPPRHFRSLSMDSFMGSLNFGDESPRLPPSPGIRSAQHSPSNSFDGNSNKFSLEFGNGEFSAAEMKKIMASDKLAEMAMADPKRVKRILANRQSAARSKERKLRYIAELEHKVQTLQTEATTLSAQLTLLQRDSAGLSSQNNELRFRLQAMEQQAQLRDALNEALTAEVQRLKLATGELRAGESHMLTNPLMQTSQSQYNSNMHQLNNEKPQQPSPQQNQPSQQSQLPQQGAKAPKT